MGKIFACSGQGPVFDAGYDACSNARRTTRINCAASSMRHCPATVGIIHQAGQGAAQTIYLDLACQPQRQAETSGLAG